MLTFFMIIMYIVPLYRLISRIVSEKQTKIREGMKMMGLTDTPYWCSWFCYFFVNFTIISFVSMLITIPVFPNSNKFYIFLYFWIYGLNMFAYSVFVSAFFSSAKAAAIVGIMVYYVSTFLINFNTESAGEPLKMVLSIFPTVSVQIATVNLLAFETGGIGI